MAKNRMINTRYWDDSYVVSLKPMEKLLFLYLFTNPLTNISGVYELPLKRAAFDTGIPLDEVEAALSVFERDGKVVLSQGWIGVVNFIKHQNLNPKTRQGVLALLKEAPKEITDRLSIGYQALSIGSDSLSHLNPNPNINTNFNPNPNAPQPEKLSTGYPEDIERRKRELLRKWKQ